MFTAPEKPTDILVDQPDMKAALGIIDARAAELLTLPQLFPDYRKSSADPSKPTIDFRFPPVRSSGGDTKGAESNPQGEALAFLEELLPETFLAFLENPEKQNTPLYALLLNTLQILATVLTTAKTASASIVDGSEKAIAAQENLLTPYVLIKSLTVEGEFFLNEAFSLLPSFPTTEKDHVLNFLNQTTSLFDSFKGIVKDLEAGKPPISSEISALSIGIGLLQEEMSQQKGVNFSFLKSFVEQLQQGTLFLSAGVGSASLLMTEQVIFSHLSEDKTNTALLSETTLPAFTLFANGLVETFEPSLSSGQKAFFASNIAALSLLILGAKSALEEGGGLTVGETLEEREVFLSYMMENLAKTFLASNLLKTVIEGVTSASGMTGEAQGKIAARVEFALLALIVYTTESDKIKENFFKAVRDSLEKLNETMKEDNEKEVIEREENKLGPYIEEMSIALKDNSLDGFCTTCDGILKFLNIPKTTIRDDLTELKRFASVVIETERKEQEIQKSMTDTSLRSSA
jgi:hypothetical protein